MESDRHVLTGSGIYFFSLKTSSIYQGTHLQCKVQSFATSEGPLFGYCILGHHVFFLRLRSGRLPHSFAKLMGTGVGFWCIEWRCQ
jgi:hypothetical protein